MALCPVDAAVVAVDVDVPSTAGKSLFAVVVAAAVGDESVVLVFESLGSVVVLVSPLLV